MNESPTIAVAILWFWGSVLVTAGVVGWIVQRRPSPTGHGLWLPPLTGSHRDALSQSLAVLGIALGWMLLDALVRDFGLAIGQLTLLLVTALAALALAYPLRAPYALLAGLLALTAWLPAQILAWYGMQPKFATWMIPAMGLMMLLFFIAGRSQTWGGGRLGQMFAGICATSGAVGLAAIMLALSAHEVTRDLTLTAVGWNEGGWRVSMLVSGMACALVAALAWAWRFGRIAALEAICCLAYAVALLAFPSLRTGTFATVELNVLATAACLAPLVLGYVRREAMMINTGVVLSLALIAVKYVDWFYSLLGRSLFFLSAGVLLLVVGWLMERARRSMLRAMAS